MVDPSGWVLCGLQTCARDLVRFGLMVQGRGRSGDSIVLESSGYLDAALSSSQELNPSYGYLWWLPRAPFAIVPGPDPTVAPDPRKTFGGRRLDHPIAPSAPDDAKAAFGAGGQRLYVSAHLDLVFVRIGGVVDRHVDLDEELWRRLRAATPDATTRS
jgi:CubicO group peptidase (beta-lactamase class C family)